MNFNLRADDRVLILPIPSHDALASMARILMRGVLVGVGPRDQVDRAREALADFDNVMLIEVDGSRIPWQDAFFTMIIAAVPLDTGLEAECNRLLAPGGRLYKG